MSSTQPERRNHTPVDASGTSTIETSSASTTEASEPCFIADPDFLSNYLNPCPANLVQQLDADAYSLKDVQPIMSVTAAEPLTYDPLASLLTNISRAVFASFSSEDKARFDITTAITFLDHHSTPLAHFPVGPPTDGPDLVGVYLPDGGINTIKSEKKDSSLAFQAVPYHRVETIVGAKPIPGEGVAQCASYLFRVQKARPDRPGLYGLYVKPDFYQVLYSSPVGVLASECKMWVQPASNEPTADRPKTRLDLSLLCAYVYSLYDPPAGVFLHDHSVSWSEPSDHLFGPPTWTLNVGDHDYPGANIMFVGNAWGRRTTVFRVANVVPVVIKECYVDSERRLEEAELLKHVHAPGFAPGVVRIIGAEDVQVGGRTIAFKDPSSQITKTKRRIVLADTGVDLEHAQSVNDLMKTFYDVLEVHRTLARERHVLHRDMSIFNILMYPMHASCVGARWQDCPPLIDDILGEPRRSADAPRTPRCLLIDFDHSAKLVENDEATQQDLCHRTGTPMYIARAVAAGRSLNAAYAINPYAFEDAKMPLLSEEAKGLYVEAYGEEHYNRYNDVKSTCHGGTIPLNRREMQGRPFYHRWEHDAESVFWTMYSVLLRVLPEGSSSETEGTHKALVYVWKCLSDHTISDNKWTIDSRAPLLECTINQFSAPFLPEMRNVATTLHKIALQVIPSYAVMPSLPPYEDHLHEAIQRLILDYLVAHRDQDIPLQPGILRNMGGSRHSMSDLKSPTGKAGVTGTVFKKNTTQDSSLISRRKRHAPEDEEHSPRAAKKARIQPDRGTKSTRTSDRRRRDRDPPVLKGEWKWSAEPAGGHSLCIQ
ncbi:hypothetical protein C8Q77DRAFT_1271109 [Trametes polyzona]|nr:hypothetical protein C8Q77DRAFT_1271109 [Trametes polyzona]